MIDTKKYAFSVSVHSAYLPDQSSPDDNQYAFAYTVNIRNIGSLAAQLISRHWIITDADNHVHEVKGLGVVGANRVRVSVLGATPAGVFCRPGRRLVTTISMNSTSAMPLAIAAY